MTKWLVHKLTHRTNKTRSACRFLTEQKPQVSNRDKNAKVQVYCVKQ